MTKPSMWDIVKIFGLEDLLHKYDPEIQEKLKSVRSDDEFVALVKVLPLDFRDDVEAHFKDLMQSRDKIGIIREDLLLTFHSLVSRLKTDEALFRDFKDVLVPEQYNALLLSSTIVNFEDRGLDKEALKLKRKLQTRHAPYGNKIYNWHRSGYIKEYFHYRLMLDKAMWENSYRDKFRIYWGDRLHFFPDSIWTNNDTKSQDIHREIGIRLNEGKKIIFVYGRGQHLIDLVKRSCEDYVDVKRTVDMCQQVSELGNSKIIKVILTSTKICKPTKKRKKKHKK